MGQHKVITSDAQIDHAIRLAKDMDQEIRASAIAYHPRLDLYIVQLSNGERIILPREMLEGLQDATRKELEHVEVSDGGFGLHWKDMDIDYSLPQLRQRIYGSRRWMAEIGHRGGNVQSASKTAAAKVNGQKGGRPKRQLAMGA